jgi:hypothetical protein
MRRLTLLPLLAALLTGGFFAFAQQGGGIQGGGSSGGTPGGSDGQVQVNNAGAFGGIAEGNSGEVLTSNGVGMAPTFQAAGGGGFTTGTFTCNYSGSFSTTETNDVVYFQIDNFVWFTINDTSTVSGTSDTTNFTSDVCIPVALRPESARRTPNFQFTDNSASVTACGEIQAVGVIQWQLASGTICNGVSNWTASGTKGMGAGFSWGYNIDDEG